MINNKLISMLAIMLSITTLLTSGICSYAMELGNGPEAVKVVSSIEELEIKEDNKKESDSIFRSCRLIITSNNNMWFKDAEHRDNIKSVQRIDNMYVVDYASIEDTQKAYDLYVASGIEVEIDVEQDSPEVEDNIYNQAGVGTEEIENVSEESDDKKDIVVAVLDSGLNSSEDIFNNKVVEGKNCVDDYEGYEDVYGHGTLMARIILQSAHNDSNNQQSKDVNTKIMPIKVLNNEGKGTTLTAYKGIKYSIEKKADVISMSISGIGHSRLLESAINDAVNNNIPVVVSAGNRNEEITEYTPANIENAITVSSAHEEINNESNIKIRDYKKEQYSNYGSDTNGIDFAADGYYEYRRTTDEKEEISTAVGTSVSAAYVTGYIALIKQIALSDEDYDNDELSYSDIYESLKKSAINKNNGIDLNNNEFGNGFLKKENIQLVTSDKEQIIQLPTETVEETEEGIDLYADEVDVFVVLIDRTYFWWGYGDNILNPKVQKAFNAIKNKSGVPFPKPINNINNQEYVNYWIAQSKEDLSSVIGTYLTNSYSHTIYFNDHVDVNNFKSNTWTIPGGTKNVYCVNTDSTMNTDGFWFKNTNNVTSPLIQINGGTCNFNDFLIVNNNGQYSNGTYYITAGVGNTNKRPVLYNKGTVNLKNVSLRAGGGAAYVFKNDKTATISGGGSTQGALENTNGASIINSGTLNLSQDAPIDANCYNNNIQKLKTAIKNTGTLNINGTSNVGSRNVMIGRAQTGIDNSGTVNINSGTGVSIHDCNVGIKNTGTVTMKAGNVYSNKSYGIDNEGTVSQSGGSIYNNKGTKPDSTDSTYVGVYQNGTYTVGGSASIYNNSLFLPNANSRLKQSGTLNGSVILTTRTSDRQIGRELITGNSNNYGNYSLAYGNAGSKTNAKYVTDSSEEGGGLFTGNKVSIRPGKLISNKTSSSCYLSGEYNISYIPNQPAGITISPSKRPDTPFFWKENVIAQFGSYAFSSKEALFKGFAQSSVAVTPTYTTNTSLTLTGNRSYYGVWEIEDTERTIIYNPNGAVDKSGNICQNIQVKINEPLSEPVTLLDATLAGGIKVATDTSYTGKAVNLGSKEIQFIAKENDIVNNLGDSGNLYKFKGWGITPESNTAYNGKVLLTSSNMFGDKALELEEFILYAIWDEFPHLSVNDIIVNRSNISREELLKSMVAIDREDGNISNSINILNYDEAVEALTDSNEYTVIFEVTDSVGNTTRASSNIKVEDEGDNKALNVITKQVRCINRHAYNTYDDQKGGCLPNSPWYNDASYALVMNSCFDNLDNNTPIASYTITKKDRQDISAYMHSVGLEHMHDKDVLQHYVDCYMNSEHRNNKSEYGDSKALFITIPVKKMIERDNRELDRLKALRNDMDLSRVVR